MRVTCTACGRRVGSYQYADFDEDGHGIDPHCDDCVDWNSREEGVTDAPRP